MSTVARPTDERTTDSTNLQAPTEQQDGTRRLEEEVERIFGDVLGTLSLSPDQLAKVKRLLVERWEVAADAHAVVTAQMTPDVAGGYLRKASAIAKAKVDEEIRTLVGDTLSAQIKQFVEESTELSTIQISFEPRFEEAGTPLAARQKAALAQLLHQTFNPVDKMPDALEQRTKDIDPMTGLSGLDRAIISSASSVLTSAQVQVLQTHLSENTKRIALSLQRRNK